MIFLDAGGAAVGCLEQKVAQRIHLRWRLARQLLTENLLLVLLGAAAALLLATWASGILTGYSGIHPSLGGWKALADPLTLLFTAGLILVTGTLITLFPLRAALRTGLQTASHMGRGSVGTGRSLAHELLVAGQLALTLALVAGAGMFLLTLAEARSADVTAAPGQVLTAEVDLSPTDRGEAEGQKVFNDLLAGLRARPDVEAASLVWIVPLGGRRGGTSMVHEGTVQVGFNVVSEDYFRTIGIPLLRGRSFSAADGPDAAPVTVVNEAFAERFLEADQALGSTIHLENRPDPPLTVVGIVRDGRFRNYRARPEPTIYLPLGQAYRSSMHLEVRTAGPLAELVPYLRGRIEAIDPGIALTGLRTHADRMRSVLSRERLSAFVLSLLGVLAVVLAAVGLFGLLSYMVAGRRKEIGVRMTLGAAPDRIVREVIGDMTVPLVTGVLAGLLGAAAFGYAVRSLLFGVDPADPAVLGGSVAVLLVTAAAAAVLPVRRAVGIDPVRALRVE